MTIHLLKFVRERLITDRQRERELSMLQRWIWQDGIDLKGYELVHAKCEVKCG